MKKSILLLLIIISLTAFGCDSGGSDSGNNQLQLNAQTYGAIESVGEVDWYRFSAVEANNILQLRCSGETMTPDVEFLVTVYEKDENGDLFRLWADHAPEGASQPADLTLNIPINEPRELHIAVRDLMDDEAAPDTRYRLQLAYTRETTDNSTFGQATELGTLNEEETLTQSDSIGHVGDVDCFHFNVPGNGGVYAVEAAFIQPSLSTPVKLQMRVYDQAGETVHPPDNVTPAVNRFLLHLDPGDHYVAIEDQGRNDEDAYAQYQVTLSPLQVSEVLENDDNTNAAEMRDNPSQHSYTAEGTLGYQQDQDWYRMDIPGDWGYDFNTIQLTLNDTATAGFPFQIRLLAPDGNIRLSHEYPSGADGYTTQVRVDSGGKHLIVVRPKADATVIQGLDYTLEADFIGINDAAEITGDGNDGIDEADALMPTETASGKIAFRGDADWYRMDIPYSREAQILGIEFQARDTSSVEYCVEIMKGGERWTLSDQNGLDAPTWLETSYMAAADETEPYFIKVCDCQNDDGADVDYDLTVTSSDVPDRMAGSSPDGSAAFYFSETHERNLSVGDFDSGEAVEVTCAVYPQYNPQFKADNTLLQVDSLDADNEYISDWIAGYIDYQGDQDWFVLDIAEMAPNGSTVIPENWYYDIEIQLYSPGGTENDVEYTWKLYRDIAGGNAPPNRIVAERTPGISNTEYMDERDGIIAAFAADRITGGSSAGIDRTVPGAAEDEEAFWIGDRWSDDRFYLSISDFNYTRTANGEDNPVPDEDWGYEAPYYFRVRLTYHPDTANP